MAFSHSFKIFKTTDSYISPHIELIYIPLAAYSAFNRSYNILTLKALKLMEGFMLFLFNC